MATEPKLTVFTRRDDRRRVLAALYLALPERRHAIRPLMHSLQLTDQAAEIALWTLEGLDLIERDQVHVRLTARGLVEAEQLIEKE